MFERKHISIGMSLTLLGMACVLQTQLVPQLAVAASTAAITEQVMAKDLGLLENRFFARQYANDPVEKRLERLELLVFGGTQDGDNAQRFTRLKKAIAERPSASAKQPTDKSTAQSGQKDKALSSSSQYPVLNTLEWRALKKTYPDETLDQRLGRLEKKLFGADNPSMAYVDRVDRLKRTLGVGVVAQQPSGPLGPAPKARPRGQMMPDMWSFGSPPIVGKGGPFSEDEDSFGMGAPGFSFGFGLPPGINKMFADMDKQMQALQNLPPGQYSFDPKSGVWIDKNTGARIKPQSGVEKALPPTFTKPNITPKSLPFPIPQRETELPPYSDPNSI